MCTKLCAARCSCHTVLCDHIDSVARVGIYSKHLGGGGGWESLTPGLDPNPVYFKLCEVGQDLQVEGSSALQLRNVELFRT